MRSSIYILILLAWISTGLKGHAQSGTLYNKGKAITVSEGSHLYVPGDLINETRTVGSVAFKAEYISEGTIHIGGDLVNNTNGKLFPENGSGTVSMDGTLRQYIRGDSIHFSNLVINNIDGVNIENSHSSLEDTLLLSSGVLWVFADTLDLGTTGSVLGEDNHRYIRGTGHIIARNRSDVQQVGLGIAVTGSTGNVTIIRGHKSVIAGEGSFPQVYHIEAVNTADITATINYYGRDAVDFDQDDLALYVSIDSTRWTKFPSSTDMINGTVTGSLTNFISGQLTISDATCFNLPVSDISPSDPVLCGGQSTILTAPANLRYNWNTNETTEEIIVHSAGDYDVRVLNDAGCVNTNMVTVRDVAQPEADFTPSASAICQNTDLTFADASSLASGTYSSLWDFVDNNTSTQNSPVHVYDNAGLFPVKLIVTSDEGCRDSVTKSVRIHPNPKAGFVARNLCSQQATDFTDTTYLPSDVAGASYAIANRRWSFGDNNTSLQANPSTNYDLAGSYSVVLQVTSNAGCTDSHQEVITIHNSPTAGFDLPGVLCEQTIFTPIDRSTGAASYEWFINNASYATFAEPEITISATGSYDVRQTVLATNGCRDSEEKTMELFQKPVADFTVENVCEGNVSNFNNLSANASAYQWRYSFFNPSTVKDWSYRFSGAGDHLVELIARSSEGCTDTIEKYTTIYPNPQISASANTVCSGQPTQYTNTSTISSGTLTYKWGFGITGETSTEKSPMFTYPLNYRDYATYAGLTVTSDKGCSRNQGIQTIIKGTPHFDFGDTLSTCFTHLWLSQTHSGTYNWSTGETVNQIKVTENGLVGLEITAPNGCTASDSVMVYIDTAIAMELGDLSVNCDSATFNAYQFGNTYRWLTPNGFKTDSAVTVTSSGQVHVTREDQYGCIWQDTVQVTIHKTPVFDLPDTTFGCGSDTTYLVTGISEHPHEWSNGSTARDTLKVTTPDTYVVTVTSGGLCPFSDTTTVDYIAYPVLNLGEETTCDSLDVDLTGISDSIFWRFNGSTQDTTTILQLTESGTLHVDATNSHTCITKDTLNLIIVRTPQPALLAVITRCDGFDAVLYAGQADKYLWSTGNTTDTQTFAEDTAFSVTLTNGGLCSQTQNSSLVYVPVPTPGLGADTTVCFNDPYLLSADFDGLLSSWYHEDSLVENNSTHAAIYPGVYMVTVTDGAACLEMDTMVLAHHPNISAEIASSTVGEVNDTLQFVEIAEPAPNNYFWDFGDGITSSDNDPLHQYFLPGTYNVMYIAGLGSCTDTAYQEVIIYGEGLSPIQLELDTIPFAQILKAVFYPNPFQSTITGEVEINQESEIHIFLFDSEGNRLFDAFYTGPEVEETYLWEELTPGAYTVVIVAGEDGRFIKLIKL